MILFHGSNVEVCTPDTIHSRSNLDFGRGFYTTSIRSQAEKWCERFKKKYGVSFISKYELDGAVFSDCSVLKFDTYLQSVRLEVGVILSFHNFKRNLGIIARKSIVIQNLFRNLILDDETSSARQILIQHNF